MIDCLIICLLFQISKTRTSSIIYKSYRIEGRGMSTWSTTFDWHWKGMVIWGISTLFRNQKQRHPQNTLHIMVTGQTFSDNSHLEDTSNLPPGVSSGATWFELCMGTFTNINRTTRCINCRNQYQPECCVLYHKFYQKTQMLSF